MKARVLPIKVDNKIVTHKEELKEYPLNSQRCTLFTAYQKYFRDNIDIPFDEFIELYSEKVHATYKYKIEPMNTRSRQWVEIVKECVSSEDVESVIRNVVNVAMGDGRNSMKAAEVLANWMGAAQKQEVSVKADATVNANVRVAPELFELPSEDK